MTQQDYFFGLKNHKKEWCSSKANIFVIISRPKHSNNSNKLGLSNVLLSNYTLAAVWQNQNKNTLNLEFCCGWVDGWTARLGYTRFWPTILYQYYTGGKTYYTILYLYQYYTSFWLCQKVFITEIRLGYIEVKTHWLDCCCCCCVIVPFIVA